MAELNFDGRYILLAGRRERIVETGDFNPPDPSVGIFVGCTDVRTKSGWHSVDTTGKVYDPGSDEDIGTHCLFRNLY
jgi:hypothetical protein